PVKQPRKRERLVLADVRAPKGRNVTSQAKAEVIVEIAEAAANNRLGSSGPGKADARRNIRGDLELRIVVPADPAVYGQSLRDPPVVLGPEGVVVVAEFDLVGVGCEAAHGQQ